MSIYEDGGGLGKNALILKKYKSEFKQQRNLNKNLFRNINPSKENIFRSSNSLRDPSKESFFRSLDPLRNPSSDSFKLNLENLDHRSTLNEQYPENHKGLKVHFWDQKEYRQENDEFNKHLYEVKENISKNPRYDGHPNSLEFYPAPNGGQYENDPKYFYENNNTIPKTNSNGNIPTCQTISLFLANNPSSSKENIFSEDKRCHFNEYGEYTEKGPYTKLQAEKTSDQCNTFYYPLPNRERNYHQCEEDMRLESSNKSSNLSSLSMENIRKHSYEGNNSFIKRNSNQNDFSEFTNDIDDDLHANLLSLGRMFSENSIPPKNWVQLRSMFGGEKKGRGKEIACQTDLLLIGKPERSEKRVKAPPEKAEKSCQTLLSFNDLKVIDKEEEDKNESKVNDDLEKEAKRVEPKHVRDKTTEDYSELWSKSREQKILEQPFEEHKLSKSNDLYMDEPATINAVSNEPPAERWSYMNLYKEADGPQQEINSAKKSSSINEVSESRPFISQTSSDIIIVPSTSNRASTTIYIPGEVKIYAKKALSNSNIDHKESDTVFREDPFSMSDLGLQLNATQQTSPISRTNRTFSMAEIPFPEKLPPIKQVSKFRAFGGGLSLPNTQLKRRKSIVRFNLSRKSK